LVIDLKVSGEKSGESHENGHSRRILLDPGFYSVEKHIKVNKIDIVLITHEHADHFHIESLKELLRNHPDVEIVTNDTVGVILSKEGIKHHIMEHGDVIDMKGVHIEAYGKDHALMHKSIALVSNIGFLIEEKVADRSESNNISQKFFFPGDAFTPIDKEVDVLALPVSGPWMKISEAIDYALQLKPKKAFPVHDAIRFGSAHTLPEKILGINGIEFIKLEEGGEILFTLN